MNAHEKRPSVLGSFLRGAGSGAFSGALMMGVFALVAATGIFGMSIPAMTLMAGSVAATSLFGGAMAAKRAVFDAPKYTINYAPDYVSVPTAAMAAPTLAPTVMMDSAPDQPSKSWVAATGREDGARRSNVQAILDNGAMSATDRAAAIAASRDMGAERGA